MITVGLERLLKEPAFAALTQGRKVGLLANPTSVDRNLKHAVDLGLDAGWNLMRLFGPEHGIRGEAQDMETVGADRDPVTKLPCVSLYGHDVESLKPDPSQLEGLDVLVIDLQDIGARYYTYIYTAAYCAEVCGQLGIDVVVCDRPNPIGGEVIEGNVVEPGYRSFVGAYPLATRHAMTIGELMRLFVKHEGLECNLTVVPMEGWTRDMWFDQTGQPWVMPSPNMPTLETAAVYPGMCLLEGTNLSEGRGTTRPFELFGAPWFNAQEMHERLTARELPGCQWRAVSFKPMFQKHGGQVCGGLQLHVSDRSVFRSVEVAMALIQDVQQLHPVGFAWRSKAYEFVSDRLAIDLLLGDPTVRFAISEGNDVDEISEMMAVARKGFEEKRASVLMY